MERQLQVKREEEPLDTDTCTVRVGSYQGIITNPRTRRQALFLACAAPTFARGQAIFSGSDLGPRLLDARAKSDQVSGTDRMPISCSTQTAREEPANIYCRQTQHVKLQPGSRGTMFA